jgi:hypothetical protein
MSALFVIKFDPFPVAEYNGRRHSALNYRRILFLVESLALGARSPASTKNHETSPSAKYRTVSYFAIAAKCPKPTGCSNERFRRAMRHTFCVVSPGSTRFQWCVGDWTRISEGQHGQDYLTAIRTATSPEKSALIPCQPHPGLTTLIHILPVNPVLPIDFCSNYGHLRS